MEENKEQEVDLVLLLKIIKSEIKKFFVSILKVVGLLFLAIKKYILYFIIVGLVGVGVYFLSKVFFPRKYVNKITISSNEDFSLLLYNRIEYLNDLRKQYEGIKEFTELGISTEDFENIKKIEITPIKNSQEDIKLYKDYISTFSNSDSSVRPLDYKTFSKSLLDISYPKQEISIFTTNNGSYVGFLKLFLFKIANSNNLITYRKNNEIFYSFQKELLKTELNNLEEKLVKVEEILFLSDKTKTQELSLSSYLEILNKKININLKINNIEEKIQKSNQIYNVLDEYSNGYKPKDYRLMYIVFFMELILLLFLILKGLNSYFSSKFKL